MLVTKYLQIIPHSTDILKPQLQILTSQDFYQIYFFALYTSMHGVTFQFSFDLQLEKV